MFSYFFGLVEHIVNIFIICTFFGCFVFTASSLFGDYFGHFFVQFFVEKCLLVGGDSEYFEEKRWDMMEIRREIKIDKKTLPVHVLTIFFFIFQSKLGYRVAIKHWDVYHLIIMVSTVRIRINMQH